ncbi:trehalose-phosphatase [Novosphingobium flavum]|uniref:Trehalose 6-phosphate phosphatase n=1 Tax=Novosphingobium flavum TaxID=1778672 RepID=A0A7X1FRY1_9SPHN|nr:trehalose-phosphatase [Novosphingobium flavum]MBC2665739.1 trehalose-phosphatase [Novosphingobium flavum]
MNCTQRHAPPTDLLDEATLFLDLDGTLLELVDRPDAVRVDDRLRELLVRLKQKLKGRLAIISGRSLQQLDEIFGEFAADLAISGSHGCEHRWNGILARPNRPPALDEAADRLRLFAQGRHGLIVEEKSFGVALHYRMVPGEAAEAQAVAIALSAELELGLQHGKMMVELRVAGGDKGLAIQRLMDRSPMKGTKPVFAGDDVTDEPGFVMARALGGHAILIGQPRPSASDFALPSPMALRAWLEETLR